MASSPVFGQHNGTPSSQGGESRTFGSLLTSVKDVLPGRAGSKMSRPSMGPDPNDSRVTVQRIMDPKEGIERASVASMTSTGWGSNSDSPRVYSSGVSLSKPSRRLRKLQVYREEFHVGDDELFLEDYLCAVQKKSIKQGRMYVFDKHIGWHANVFGHHKFYSIPIKDITKVAKASNMGFPNSLRIAWGSNSSLFFTSFLNREDAYKLIMHLWRQLSDNAPDEEASSDSSDDETLNNIKRPVKKLLSTVGLSTNSMTSPGSGKPETEAVTEDTQEGSADQDSDDSDWSDDEAGNDDEDGGYSAAMTDGDPPAVEEGAKAALEYSLKCSAPKFWSKFLADSSNFFKEFHESRGDSSVKHTKWRKHSKCGMVRDLQFVTPVKMKMGPDSTLCSQTQHFTAYKGDRLVFQTTQTMNDIPYSDHFTADSRWDVTPDGNDACTVKVYVFVPFSKKTMWRSFIEKGVREGCLTSFSAWRDMAKDDLAGKKSSQKSTKASSKGKAGGSGDLEKQPSLGAGRDVASGAKASATPSLAAFVSGASLNTFLLTLVVLLQLWILWRAHGTGPSPAPRPGEGEDSLRSVLRQLVLELRDMRLQDATSAPIVGMADLN